MDTNGEYEVEKIIGICCGNLKRNGGLGYLTYPYNLLTTYSPLAWTLFGTSSSVSSIPLFTVDLFVWWPQTTQHDFLLWYAPLIILIAAYNFV